MSGLIGGSGSTGSSLLRQILNRHSAIFCGPETSLFCKPELYTNWNRRKKHLLSRGYYGLKNHSFHIYRGTDLIKEEIGLSKENIMDLVHQSDRFQDFTDAFYQKVLETKGKTYWLEKTPSNAFSFNNFQQHLGGQMIHIYREPYDTICSLHKRGFSIFEAAAMYLLNTSFALSKQRCENYFMLSYENLTSQSQIEMTQLCEFLGFKFEAQMLTDTKTKVYQDDPSKLVNWNHDEAGPVNKKRSNGFDQLPELKQQRIHQAIKSLKIKDQELQRNNLAHADISSLALTLGYELRNITVLQSKKTLSSEMYSDLIRRTRKLSFYHLFNYPLTIS